MAMETGVIIWIAVFIIAGILTAIFPEYAWYLSRGIWYKDSEPTDFALIFTRIGGVIIAVIGAFIMLTALKG